MTRTAIESFNYVRDSFDSAGTLMLRDQCLLNP